MAMADPLDFQKGTLDLMILRALSRGQGHGYAIARWIEQSTGDALQVGDAALYPALHRLEERGFVVAEWGITATKREAKFYRLTAVGKKKLVSAQENWNRYAAAMAAVFNSQLRLA
jgi:PadR family transcriptional regulator PadR